MRKIEQDPHSNDVLKLPISGPWKINNLANGKTFVIASGVTHIKLAKTGQDQAGSKEAGQEAGLVE